MNPENETTKSEVIFIKFKCNQFFSIIILEIEHSRRRYNLP